MGRLGGLQVRLPLLQQEGGVEAASHCCTGFPRGELRGSGDPHFVEILAPHQ